MTTRLFWLGSAFCGALFVGGCSSSGGNGDGGSSTGGSTTATAGTGGTSTGGSSGAGSSTSAGTSTASSTGTTTGSSTGHLTSSGGGTTTGSSTGGSSTGAAVMVGDACDPNATPDRVCAPAGFVCDPALDSCQLPGNLVPCLMAVGCAPGLSCSPSGSGSLNICVQVCASGDECADPTTACKALGSTSVTACLPNVCNNAYLTCDSSGTGDGTCYPATGTAALFCVQGGTVAENEPCGSARSDAGDLCAVNTICINFGTATACLPLCAAGAPSFPDSGPGCADNSLCAGLSTSLGTCLQKCTAPADCPSPFTQCVALQGLTGTFCIP